MPGPLQGVRVLDLTRLLPGAYATQLLADLGCDVIKVEDPRGGDPMRHLRITDNPQIHFERVNRGKRSVVLDLRSPEAMAVLDALIVHADVLVESFRPSTARRLGVDGAALRRRHSRLIHASISGFGQSGPYAERAAHDLNYQALAGAVRPPRVPDQLVGDIGSAMTAALRIVAALVERSQTGSGSALDISIHEAAMPWATFPRAVEFPPERYNLYETADGQWLALGALEQKFWAGFCERLGVPPSSGVDQIRAAIRSRSRAHWLAHFEGHDVCLTPVHSTADVAADPHIAARGLLRPGAPAPALGEHTDEVLAAVGISADDRRRLRERHVIA